MANQQTPSQPVKRKVYPIEIKRIPYVTYALLGVIALVYLQTIDMTIGQKNLFLWNWAKINENIYQGEYYRLVSSMFIHIDSQHFIFNSMSLFFSGRYVERLYGSFRFTIIYFLGGITGSMASLFYTNGVSIGASGAIFAIFAAAGVFWYHHRELVVREQAMVNLRVIILFAVVIIISGFTPDSRIDNAAHIGGVFGGYFLAWFMSPALELEYLEEESALRLVDRNSIQEWALIPSVYMVAIIVSLILLTMRYA